MTRRDFLNSAGIFFLGRLLSVKFLVKYTHFLLWKHKINNLEERLVYINLNSEKELTVIILPKEVLISSKQHSVYVSKVLFQHMCFDSYSYSSSENGGRAREES